jgi:hypothetical protein
MTRRKNCAADHPLSIMSASDHANTPSLRELGRLTIPWGAQDIELHEIVFNPGSAPLLRIRIREGRRFTIFDVDPASATHWGRVMIDWAAEVSTANPRTDDSAGTSA